MKLKDFLSGIAALAFLILLIILGWGLFTSMVKVFGEFTSAVEPTIVVAIISGLGAIIVNAISKHGERKHQIFMKVKEKMTEIYESFIKDFNNASDEEIASVFNKYSNVFAVNASDDTYREFLILKESKNKDLTRLIVSIRNDLKVSAKKNKKQGEKYE